MQASNSSARPTTPGVDDVERVTGPGVTDAVSAPTAETGPEDRSPLLIGHQTVSQLREQGIDVDAVSLGALKLRPAIRNLLDRAGLRNVGQLAGLTDDAVLDGVRGLGPTKLAELKLALAGLSGDPSRTLDDANDRRPGARHSKRVADDARAPQGLLVLDADVADGLRMRGVDLRTISLNALSLSPRAMNPLVRAGFQTVGEIAELCDDELLHRVRGFGIGLLEEVMSALAIFADGYLCQPLLTGAVAPTDQALDASTSIESTAASQSDSSGQQELWTLGSDGGIAVLLALQNIAAWASGEMRIATLLEALDQASEAKQVLEIDAAHHTLASTTACRIVATQAARTPLIDLKMLSSLSVRGIEADRLPVGVLQLSRRTQACLVRASIMTVGQLTTIDRGALARRGAPLDVTGIEELRRAVDELVLRDAQELRATHIGGASNERFLDALTAIVAWAVQVRGTLSVLDAIQVARSDDSMPGVLRLARRQVFGVDLGELAGGLKDQYCLEAVIQRVRCQFDDRQQAVLRARPLALGSPMRFADLAAEIGVAEDAAKKLVKRAETRLTSLLAGPELQIVHRAARALRSDLGAACPLDALPAPIREAFSEHSSAADRFDTGLLLSQAGPYGMMNGWLVRVPASTLVSQTAKLMTAATTHGSTPIAVVEASLEELETRPEHRARWISSVTSGHGSFKVVGDLVVRLRTLADRAEAVLLAHGSPMARDELSSLIETEHDVSSLVDQMRLDPRFIRTGRSHFGLASWPHEPYVPIQERIVREIERSGGEAEIECLVRSLTNDGDVLEASVRGAVSHPRFVRSRPGYVAVRPDDAAVHSRRTLESTSDCYRLAAGWALRVTVTEDTLRGCGVRLPTSFATYLGLRPGDSGILRTPHGGITCSWKSQAYFGSIRMIAEAMKAEVGDHIFLEYLGESVIRTHLVSAQELRESDGAEWIARRVGMQPAEWTGGMILGLASTLGLGGRDAESLWAVRCRLQARGEKDLLDRLPKDEVELDENALDELLSYCAVGL